MQIIMALAAGLLFGIGLVLSGMTDPGKVVGFLDLAGKWDPSLALVMAGAVAVSFIPFHLASRHNATLLGGPMHLPSSSSIDQRLVLGSLTFGVGWGLAGYCPGPALASLLTGGAKPVIFVLAMVAGMMLFEWLQAAASRKP